MIFITLVSWLSLYQFARRVVAYEYRRRAVAITGVVALCIELWLTRDFARLVALKFF